MLFKNNLPILAMAILLFGFCFSCKNEAPTETTEKTSAMYDKTDIASPIAKKEAKELTAHGDTRIDNYYWLKLTDEQKNATAPDAHTGSVVDYLNAENAYLDTMLSHTKKFQEELFQEMKGRIKEDDQSVPYKDRGYYYISRYEEGKEYPIYSRKEGSLNAEEEVMLDVNTMAEGFDFYNVGGRSVSQDNKMIAYGEDTLSRRIYTLKFKNLETGELLEDAIPNTGGRGVWANDNMHVFYSVKDETLRPYQIYRHKLGTPVEDDVLIYEEPDDTFAAYVYKTKSDKYIMVAAYQTVSTEYHIIDADNPTGPMRVLQPRERNLEYDVAHFADKFYVRTNLDAKNFRLMETSVDATEKENWTEVIAHRDDVLLEGMDIFKDHLVLSERKKGITQLRIRPWDGEEHYVDFGEDAYLAYTSVNPDFNTNILRLGYQSMTTPATTYDYDMNTKAFEMLKQREVLGGFNADDYVSERVFATARDGAKVPMSIVYKKGFERDGSQPLMLYGYGSYGSSMEPYFSSTRLSLLNRGFVYAIAHIRGGEEMGRHWYEDGKLMNKKNTFTDFIDCAEYLIAEDYTSQDRIFAMGGSAGGLLMGAVINMRPDLWKGIVAEVPFVDVVTTMLDETIPLTTGEYDEWGNPNEPAAYEYIKSYSPYDNVEAKDYPAMLVTTGLHDSQVQYWEPAKWVAKLREMKTGSNPLLLHTNMEAGHGGASGRFEALKEMALVYAFILDLAGKNESDVKG